MKRIILLSGKMRVGKNQFADFFIDELKHRGLTLRTDLFAHDLKNGCKEDFKIIADYLNGYVDRLKATANLMSDLKSTPAINAIDQLANELKVEDHNFFEDKTEFTRLLLQLYGTEIFRNRVDPDWWAKQVRDRAIECDDDFVIVTDTRFPNEIEVFYDNIVDLDEMKIITIRINRDTGDAAINAEHPSETSLDDWKEWNYIVENNGTLDDLKGSVTTIINDILEVSDED